MGTDRPLEGARDARDRGSVLPLVLVLIVVGGLMVVPLLTYTVAVFKANHVVSERTKALEASRGGMRVALANPRDVFLTCDGSGDLPAIEINELSVSSTCTEIDEVGPLDALGYEVPVGAVAMQLGATVPAGAVGTTAQSDPVPPYPAAPDWWAGQESTMATNDTIWTPNLPQWPAVTRSSTPFDMPPTFGCQVFFPGRYSDPVEITDGQVYFTSGVYYFESSVTISGDADVVVGYGLEEFGNDCADDIQVAANVLGDPGTFAIDGGGGTFVFGADGRLIVDDTAGGSPSIRFNQRYAAEDRGGRVSIMTVNGHAGSADNHVVDRVNHVPQSAVVDAGTEPVSSRPMTPGTYETSAIEFTDAARPPLAPTGVVVEWLRTSATSPPGAARITWDAVAGQAAGGALLDDTAPYEVRVTRNSTVVACQPGSFAVSAGTGTAGADQVSCLVAGLPTSNPNHTVSVAAVNGLFTGEAATVVGRPRTGGANPSQHVTPVAPPTDVVVAAGDEPDEARVSWTGAADAPTAAPVLGYDVTAYRVDVTDDPTPLLIETEVGTCSTESDPFEPTPTVCEMTGLPHIAEADLTDGTETGALGYRFDVVAHTEVDQSPAASSVEVGGLPDEAPFPLDVLPIGFDGDGEPLPATDERYVVPWIPEPVVDIQASGGGASTVSVAGYVAVPMGRLRVDSPGGDDIRIVGGVMAGTYDVSGATVGFENDIVLQRTVRVTSTAGNTTSVAIVQLNEDGAGYAINEWVVE